MREIWTARIVLPVDRITGTLKEAQRMRWKIQLLREVTYFLSPIPYDRRVRSPVVMKLYIRDPSARRT
jgi:hypothetical protein